MRKAKDIIVELSKTLKTQFNGSVKDIILYGSRARRDNDVYSDYDIMVLVHRRTRKLQDKICDTLWGIGYKYNVSISPFVYEKEKFDGDKYEPLFINVRREGVKI